ncbi:MAG: Ig domain-containing protein [Clostridia bacterium]|nr:Ig domain-containing protein [Clostridia bacterium]
MNIGKKWLASALCAFALVGMAGCGGKNETEDVRITLSETMIEMVVGETKELKASVVPSDAMDKSIMWESSDEKVVVVDGGMLTAKEEGKATITATTSGKSATCEVTVKPKSETRMK